MEHLAGCHRPNESSSASKTRLLLDIVPLPPLFMPFGVRGSQCAEENAGSHLSPHPWLAPMFLASCVPLVCKRVPSLSPDTFVDPSLGHRLSCRGKNRVPRMRVSTYCHQSRECGFCAMPGLPWGVGQLERWSEMKSKRQKRMLWDEKTRGEAEEGVGS